MSKRMIVVALALLGAIVAGPAAHAQEAQGALNRAEQSRALERAANAVVGLNAVAVEGARSAATLGSARQGSGVVIDAQGLVLTIGYLILQAAQVLLVTDDRRQVDAVRRRAGGAGRADGDFRSGDRPGGLFRSVVRIAGCVDRPDLDRMCPG